MKDPSNYIMKSRIPDIFDIFRLIVFKNICCFHKLGFRHIFFGNPGLVISNCCFRIVVENCFLFLSKMIVLQVVWRGWGSQPVVMRDVTKCIILMRILELTCEDAPTNLCFEILPWAPCCAILLRPNQHTSMQVD